MVRRFWEALSREPMTLEGLRAGELDWLIDEFYPPDAVFEMGGFEGWPESETYEGHDGVRSFYEAWFGPWESMSFELERLERVGDVVLSVVLARGTGASSRTPVEQSFALLTTVRDSKFAHARFFTDPNEAVRAAEAARTAQ